MDGFFNIDPDREDRLRLFSRYAWSAQVAHDPIFSAVYIGNPGLLDHVRTTLEEMRSVLHEEPTDGF